MKTTVVVYEKSSSPIETYDKNRIVINTYETKAPCLGSLIAVKLRDRGIELGEVRRVDMHDNGLITIYIQRRKVTDLNQLDDDFDVDLDDE